MTLGGLWVSRQRKVVSVSHHTLIKRPLGTCGLNNRTITSNPAGLIPKMLLRSKAHIQII